MASHTATPNTSRSSPLLATAFVDAVVSALNPAPCSWLLPRGGAFMVNRYFRRAARFVAKGDQLFVVDRNSPRIITMDPWPQVVFLAADGEHTVQQFVDRLGATYADGTPVGLLAQIEALIEQLVQEGILELTDEPSPLPHYLAVSVSEQDPAMAKAQMIADGFIPAGA